MAIYYFQISLLQTPPALPAPSGPLAPPSSSSPTWEALTYILVFISDFRCFRLEQQHLGQKLRVFVCSEILWALELYKSSFPFRLSRQVPDTVPDTSPWRPWKGPTKNQLPCDLLTMLVIFQIHSFHTLCLLQDPWLSNAYWMPETPLSFIQYFKDLHIVKGLGNKRKNHLKHLVGPTLGVELPPVTVCRVLCNL